MQFQLKMPENGRKHLFRYKQTTNKVPLMFFDVKMLTEKVTITILDADAIIS